MNDSLTACLRNGFQAFCICILFSSCAIYQKRILFKTADSVVPENVQAALLTAQHNYTLQEHDYIEMRIYTNGGELIIDPNQEIQRAINAGGMNQQQAEKPQFLIRKGGYVTLPLIREVKLAGLTLQQADSLLGRLYAPYYEDVFVRTKYVSKRVIVLGATGGQVIPLPYEGMNLLEVLALAGGTDMQARVDNIRLIRGDLANPEVQLIDLTTIEGMKKANLQIMPNDIIYVEPMQRVAYEALRDISPVLGLLTSVVTLVVLIARL